jgi:hypothetical protein
VTTSQNKHTNPNPNPNSKGFGPNPNFIEDLLHPYIQHSPSRAEKSDFEVFFKLCDFRSGNVGEKNISGAFDTICQWGREGLNGIEPLICGRTSDRRDVKVLFMSVCHESGKNLQGLLIR